VQTGKLIRGIFTSEFWACLAAVALAETQALTSSGKVNLGMMATAALYAIARAIVKQGAGGGAGT
jgi:hypothetical protein